MTWNPWTQRDEEDDGSGMMAAEQPPPPMAAQLPARGNLSAMMRPNDPEMDDRWKQAENSALDQSGYMGKPSYGVGEAVRDFAPLAVAGTLDAFVNKGQGLGAIAQATGDVNAQGEKLRRDQATQAGTFARGARAQREAGTRINAGMYGEQRRQDQADMMNNPDHPSAKAQREKLIAAGVPAEMVEGQSLRGLEANKAAYTAYFKHGAADITTGDLSKRAGSVRDAQHASDDTHAPVKLAQDVATAGDTAAASEDARIQAQLANEPGTTGAAARKNAAVARSGIDPEVEKQTALYDAGVGPGAGMSGHMSVQDLMQSNQGLDFTNPKLVQDALKTRSLTKDVVAKIDGANRGAEVIDRLHDAANQFQEAVANGDVKGAWNARRLYNSHAIEYAGTIEQITGNKSDAAKRDAMALVPSLADPTAPEGVMQLWSSIEANVDANLGTYGIKARKPQSLGGPPRDAVAKPQPGAADQPDPRARGGAQPMDFMGGQPSKAGDEDNGFTTPPQLPVTNQRRGQVPPNPATPIGPGQARSGFAGQPQPEPAASGGGIKLQPSGMADGSFYATDMKTGRRIRISKEQAAQVGQ